ncbi:hypothetical protein NC653_038204 [Populus alba x Populus x berolinensis]|uniref:Phytocyanin domain-containing protein n=3 Tax=Populus TaxID=3689 RepID=A0AAD6PSZ1_9ROSI|nr:hypothetical protein NC653_038204 [Populus alba x Populus x berolinensis]
MENSGRMTIGKSVLFMAITAVTFMMIVKCAAAEQLHKVGSRGWIPNYNYTDWLSQSHEHFYVGDWLLFVFDKHSYNVLEVNKTNYENCNDQGFIKNITRGGRDVVQLTEARPYYFLSSGGYCWNGMKVAINVEDFAPTPAPASSTENGSPSNMPMGIEKVCHGMRGVERWVEYKYYTTVQVIKWYIDDSMIQIWAKMKGKAYKKTDAESMAKQKVLSNVVDTLSDILEIDSEDKVQLSVSGYQQIQIWGPSTLSQFLFGVLKPEYHDEEDLEALTNFQYKGT